MDFTGERLVTELPPQWGVVEHLHRYALAIELCAGKRVLDIASGEGYGSNLLASRARIVYGVDISAAAIAHSTSKYRKSNLVFQAGSADSIPLPDGSVDVVTSFETIEHHDRHDEMFIEFRRILVPDGVVLLSSPEKSIYSRRDPDNKYHIKEITMQELKELVHRHFSFACFFEQRAIVGTLLSAEAAPIAGLKLYDGDFTSVMVSTTRWPDHSFLNRPFFNVVLCSNKEIGPTAVPHASFFNASSLYDCILSRCDNEAARSEVLNSRTYRVGRLVLLPYRAVKWVLRRLAGS